MEEHRDQLVRRAQQSAAEPALEQPAVAEPGELVVVEGVPQLGLQRLLGPQQLRLRAQQQAEPGEHEAGQQQRGGGCADDPGTAGGQQLQEHGARPDQTGDQQQRPELR